MLKSTKYKQGIVTFICNPSRRKVEAERFEIQCHPQNPMNPILTWAWNA